MSIGHSLSLKDHGYKLMPSGDKGHFVWRKINSREFTAVVYLWDYEKNNCAVDIWLDCHNGGKYDLCKRYLVENQEQLDFLVTSNVRINIT